MAVNEYEIKYDSVWKTIDRELCTILKFDHAKK